MRLWLESGACAIATCGRGRDMADGTVREIFHDRTNRHDWDFGGSAVATHFRHRDVSNLDTSLGHKAILHNPNGARARRIARLGTERLDTGLSLDLHRRRPSPQSASLDRHMIRPIDGH